MELYLDSANLREIEELASWGVLSGVTTNPSLVAREGRDFHQVVREIARLIPGPVSAEVIATDAPGMLREAEALRRLAENVVIKVPMTAEGLKAVKALSSEGVPTNVTLVFSANQALLAARAGATYVSSFVGRMDDIGNEGMAVVRDVVEIFRLHGIQARVIAASIRHPMHVQQAAQAGAHIATCPYAVLKRMLEHPQTEIGLERFLSDWRKALQG